MPKKPAALKAIVIDDAYALPTPATLRQYLKPLRTFLMRNPGSKTWFDDLPPSSVPVITDKARG
ncbi:hypothetical protein IPR29_22095 [Xanthomonas perforans]|nr:hypothetical protein [Xanthomonas perforans]